MTLARKLWLGVLGIVLALLAVVTWLLATESGLRFLFARANSYLPAELGLGEPSGSLLRGVCVDSLEWNSDSLDITVRRVCIDVALWKLVSRELDIHSVGAEQVTVAVTGTGDTEADGGLPVFETPWDISVASSVFRDLSFRSAEIYRQLDEIQFSGSLAGSRLDVSNLVLRSAWLNADLDGDFEFAGQYPGRLNLEWQWSESPSLNLAGTLKLDGDIQRYALSHTLSAPQRLSTTGNFAYVTNELTLNLANTWEAIEWPVGASLLQSSNGSLLLRGSPSRLGVQLDALAKLDELPETRVTVAGEYATNQFSITAGQLKLGSNRVDVRGSVGDQLSMTAELDLPAIDELLPGAAGRLSAELSLRGSREQPEIRIRASGADVVWADYAVGSLAIDADTTRVQRVLADIKLENLTLRGNELDVAHFAVEGALDEHSVRAELSGKDSQVNASVSGSYTDSQWKGTIDSLNLDSQLAGSWSSPEPADVTATGDAFSLSRICLVRSAEPGEACVAASTGDNGTTAFDLEVTALPLVLLPLALPNNVSLSGFGNAQVRGSLINGRMTGEGSANLQEAKIDATVDEEELSVGLADATWRATVADNRLTSSLQIDLADGVGGAELDISVDDILDFGSAISGRGRITTNDMSLFAIFVPDITNPRGVIVGDLEISGTPDQPEFLGAIEVSDGAFGLRQAGIAVVDLSARLSQTSVGRLRFEGSARSGDGQIAIQGDTWVSADTGIRAEVRLTGEDFELLRLPDWQVAASPSISVVFDDRAANVTGSLSIPTADIRVREIPQTATSPSPDAVIHEQQGALAPTRRRIDVDVEVGLGESVSFTGFGLTTGIAGDVRLRGGTHEPYTGSGRLSLQGGRYKAYGQDLEIERGQLIFNGPLENPQLDVRAVRRTTDVVAGILLTGTPSRLRSSVFSEPPLRDAEALSYLLTGRPLASATTAGEGDRLNSAAFALGISSAGSIVSQVRSSLGLETLAVEGGAEDGRLIAGKRFGDRLVVEYGYGLIDKLGTLLLRYQLSDRFTLESRTGTVSNLDILYSVKKK